jgi:osmotically-inducible protein OsmY
MRYLNYLIFIAALGSLQGCFPLVAVGVGTGALMVADRRTSGAYIEDQSIEFKASNLITVKYKDTLHTNITSYNRHALITGEVPNEEIKSDVAKIVAGVTNVKGVSNELVISGNSGLASRAGDGFISTDVKLRFMNNKEVFHPEHIKVVTENGTVFLMGSVYRKEADAASEITSTTKGVRNVVKVFEYLD